MSPRREPNPDIRRGRSVVHTLHAHLVFTPTYRRGPFTDEILHRCKEIMRDVCTDFGAELREFNGERDHVHLLVHYPPKVAVSRLVGSLKGVSARRLRQEFPGHIRTYLWGEHFWSPSYFAASCGGAPLSVIKEYIEAHRNPDRNGADEHRWHRRLEEAAPARDADTAAEAPARHLTRTAADLTDRTPLDPLEEA